MNSGRSVRFPGIIMISPQPVAHNVQSRWGELCMQKISSFKLTAYLHGCWRPGSVPAS
jgi:hypothetical protein